MGAYQTTRAAVLTKKAMASTGASFSRKFELISGWTVLKTVLPNSWDADVQKAAFNVLFGRVENGKVQNDKPPAVSCPFIMPAILSALDDQLRTFAENILLRHASNSEGITPFV